MQNILDTNCALLDTVDTIHHIKEYEIAHKLVGKFVRDLSVWEELLATSQTAKIERNLLITKSADHQTANKVLHPKLKPELWFEATVDHPLNELPLRYFDKVIIDGLLGDPTSPANGVKDAIKLVIDVIRPLLRVPRDNDLNTGSRVAITTPESFRTTNYMLKFIKNGPCTTLDEQNEYNAQFDDIDRYLNNIFQEYGFGVVNTGNKLYALILDLNKVDPEVPEWPLPKTLPTKLVRKLEAEESRIRLELVKTVPLSRNWEIISKYSKLANKSNSCYIDSVLFPFLIMSDWTMSRRLLDADLSKIDLKACASEEETRVTADLLKKELNRLSSDIKDPESVSTSGTSIAALTCVDLRKILSRCVGLARFSTSDQMDDSEFLVNLMSIFNISPTKVEKVIDYTNDPNVVDVLERSVSQHTEAFLEIVIDIDQKNKKSFPINDIIEHYQRDSIDEASDYLFGENRDKRFKKETETILDSNCLIFHVNRFINTGGNRRTKLKTPVVLHPYIEKNGKYFTLSMITIHTGSTFGGHYYTYFKSDGVWFIYDDLDSATPRRVRWETVRSDSLTNSSIVIYT